MEKFIMALDSGTTSNRCILFDKAGNVHAMAQKEFTQYFPQPGWVEHDGNEIFASILEVARQALVNGNIAPSQIAAIGITNQRETTLVWDKLTGQPVYHAIVWQCRRTSEYCKQLEQEGAQLLACSFHLLHFGLQLSQLRVGILQVLDHLFFLYG